MKPFISGAYASPDKHNFASSNVFDEINLYIVLALEADKKYNLEITEETIGFSYSEPLNARNGVPLNDLDIWEIQKKLSIDISKLDGTQILNFAVQLTDKSGDNLDTTQVKVLHQKYN